MLSGLCVGRDEDDRYEQSGASMAQCVAVNHSERDQTTTVNGRGMDGFLESTVFQIVIDLVGPIEADKFLGDNNVRNQKLIIRLTTAKA